MSVRHPRGVLDTSSVILLPSIVDAATLPDEPLITAITLAELSVGPLVARDECERAARQAHLQQAEADFVPLAFDAAAARTFGRVAASLRQAGRKPAARVYDAMIAATALANDLPVYTANPRTSAESTTSKWSRSPCPPCREDRLTAWLPACNQGQISALLRRRPVDSRAEVRGAQVDQATALDRPIVAVN